MLAFCAVAILVLDATGCGEIRGRYRVAWEIDDAIHDIAIAGGRRKWEIP